MERKKAYISIPITGRDIEEVRKESKIVEQVLNGLGYDTFNPLDLEKSNPGQSWEWYMDQDLKIIQSGTLNAVFLCKGWRQSSGCMLEYKTALHENGMGIRHIDVYEITRIELSPEGGSALEYKEAVL